MHSLRPETHSGQTPGQPAMPGTKPRHWTLLLQQACGHFKVEYTGAGAPLQGEISLHHLGSLELTRIRTNATHISSMPSASSPDRVDDRYCFLVIQRQGICRISQHGTTVTLTPGDMTVIDPARDCHMHPQGSIEHLSLRLDRALMRERLGCFLERVQHVSHAAIFARMIHHMADEILLDTGGHDPRTGDDTAVRDAIASLLSQCLHQRDNVQPRVCVDDLAHPAPADTRRSPAGKSLLALAHRYIETSCANPNLTPADISGHLGISVRQLYRLFEDDGDTICRFLHRTRLKHAATQLSMHERTGSITDIAYACGFNDAAHFSKSFRRQFGQSPRDYRSDHRHRHLMNG